ncbi:MAG: polysaccharide biosynthesis protein [Clostridia bacterium]|nr:polysaccharide biosynthesis protein [Clostridia bacterium]
MQNNKRKQQSFEYGAIILLCSTILVKIIGAVFKIPLSNLLGEVGRGYFYRAYDIFNPIYTLAMAGLPIAVSKVVAEHFSAGRYKDVRQSLTVTKKIFTITGLIAFVLMLVIVYFLVFLNGNIEQSYSMFIIAPALLFCCVMSAYRGYFEGLRNMYPTAISNIIESLGKLILGLGFAFAIMNVTGGNEALGAAGAMLGIVIGGAASAVFLHCRYKLKGDGITKSEYDSSVQSQDTKTAIKAIIAIAVPVALASLANTVTSFIDVVMVNFQLDNLVDNNADFLRKMYEKSIADYNATRQLNGFLNDDKLSAFLYGVRGNAFTLYNLIPTITSVLGVSALPVVASAWKKNNFASLNKNIESTIKLASIISMPAGIGFIFLGKNIMSLLYSDVASYEIGGPMLQIYGFAAIFAGLAIPLINILQAIGKEKISLLNVAYGAVIKVIVNFIFVSIPQLNVKGAAIGTLASYIIIFFANFFSVIKFTKMKPNVFNIIFKPFFAGVCCGLTTLILNINFLGKFGTVIEIAVSAIVYFIILVLFNTFSPDDVLALPKGEKVLKAFIKFKIIR